MATTNNEALVDWGHLDALVKDSLPATTWFDRVDLGFEQIAVTEDKISFLKERLASQSLKASKKLKVQCQLDDLTSKLAKLKASHEEGAKIIRSRALGLAALPREMRDAILEEIYVQPEPVEIRWSRLGNGYVYYMPKDKALYMSSMHVGPEIAREASEIFYQKNTFSFVRTHGRYACYFNSGLTCWEQAQIDGWFSRDHYGSGVVPKDLVRSLEIRLDRAGSCYAGAVVYDWQTGNDARVGDHIAFEGICDSITQPLQDYRPRIKAFLQYETLQNIRFLVPYLGDSFDTTARMLNPVVRDLQAAGINVTFFQLGHDESVPDLDVSSIFLPPSDEDYAEYYQVTQRKTVFSDEPGRDIFDTWKIVEAGGHGSRSVGDMVRVYQPESKQFGFVRVWLFEHYEMFKFNTRDGKLYEAVDDIVQEFRNLSPEDRDLRRRIYPKIMDQFR